ncbi:hypothetical protein TNCV_1540421 [Trichonephila clavipes]|nr:hypothetical protein TNCV_1540421 [Trichonephila clavipes]
MFFNAGVGGTIIVESGVERSRTTQICQRPLTLLTNQLPLNNLNDCFKTLDESRVDEKFRTLLEELWHEMSFLFLRSFEMEPFVRSTENLEGGRLNSS